jgi:hypothetical protein
MHFNDFIADEIAIQGLDSRPAFPLAAVSSDFLVEM